MNLLIFLKLYYVIVKTPYSLDDPSIHHSWHKSTYILGELRISIAIKPRSAKKTAQNAKTFEKDRYESKR